MGLRIRTITNARAHIIYTCLYVCALFFTVNNFEHFRLPSTLFLIFLFSSSQLQYFPFCFVNVYVVFCIIAKTYFSLACSHTILLISPPVFHKYVHFCFVPCPTSGADDHRFDHFLSACPVLTKLSPLSDVPQPGRHRLATDPSPLQHELHRTLFG